MSEEKPPEERVLPADKVKQFPLAPGVYLMKDEPGRVLYVGKAKNLRNRAGHYFTKAAAEDQRTADLVKLIADIDFMRRTRKSMPCSWRPGSSRTFSRASTSSSRTTRSFPYLQIRIREEFPRVEFTRSPRRRGVKLYGPFTSAKRLRAAMQVLQRIFKFRTCSLDIAEDDRMALVSALPVAQHSPMHRPVQLPRHPGRIPQANSPPAPGAGREEGQAAARDGTRDGRGQRAAAVREGRPGCATKSRRSKTSACAARWTRTCSRKCFRSSPKRASPACARSWD